MPRIPEGIAVITPRLCCRDAAGEIEFCKTVFGAAERVRRPGPDGRVAHALLDFGTSTLMIESEWPAIPSRAPQSDGSSPVVLYIYVENADDTVDRAVAAGGRILFPLQDQFWGDRIAWVMDPAGHVWTVASRIEETTEQQRRDRWEEQRQRA